MATITRRQFAQLAGAGAATLSLGGLLAACTNGDAGKGDAKPEEGVSAGTDTSKQVIVSMTPGSEPAAGFDPLVSWGCGEHVHEPLIQSTLIATTTELGFQNDLATSYEASADGLTWTFAIRDDVKFTDGQPLTARDVAFTLNGIRNAEASECDLSMMKEAVATDDTTVEISLDKPFNALLYTLAVIGIVPEHAYDDSYGDHPIGSGRYMLEQWDKGQQVILKANPDYYGDAPKMERVVVVFMEEDASLAAAQSGQVDVAYTAATFADNQPMGYDLLNCKSVDSRGISLPSVPAGGTKKDEGGEYAAGNDVTCDLAVRQAINYGVDRERMIDNVLNGYGTVAYSVGDGMPWSSTDMKCTTDVEKAKKLLDDGGWAAGADGIREKDGTRATLDLYYSAGDSVRQAIAAEFANQMKDARHRGEHQGRQLGRPLPSPVHRPGGVGLGHQRPYRDVQPVLLGRHRQLRLLRERDGGRLPRRGAQHSARGGLVRVLEEGAVGRHDRLRPAGRRAVGVVRQRRPPVLREGEPQGGEAEAAPARPRLVAGEQRRPVDVGLMFRRRGGVRIAPSRSNSPELARTAHGR